MTNAGNEHCGKIAYETARANFQKGIWCEVSKSVLWSKLFHYKERNS